jgi:hypothetical protein
MPAVPAVLRKVLMSASAVAVVMHCKPHINSSAFPLTLLKASDSLLGQLAILV